MMLPKDTVAVADDGPRLPESRYSSYVSVTKQGSLDPGPRM